MLRRLQSHYSVVVPLILQSCDRRFNPTIQYLANCVSTLTDNAYALHMQNAISTSEFRDLVNLLRNHQKNNREIRETVEYADRMILIK